MKILLINPPMCIDDSPKFISFGIAYIAQELKKNDYRVDILDIDGNRFSKDEVEGYIKNVNADMIGIGGLVTVYPYLHWLIPQIRKLKGNVPIILGGAVASSLKERCFEKLDIDFEVIGEGEVTIIELLKEIAGNKNFASVNGIGFRENGKIIFTPSRPLMPSLDNVPMIDYQPFPEDKLLKNSDGVLQIHVQRGCPGSCTFCFNCFRVVDNRVRYRPVSHVVNEIETFKNQYAVKLFALAGECVMLNKKWIINFCQEVLRRNLKIKYRVTSRADTVDEERLKWLKKSGCIAMSLGLETGSEKIIKIMKKRATIDQGRKAALLARKYIPNIEIGIILGYIGEDENTLRETIDFCKGLNIKPILFHATPFPGTELYKTALERNAIKDEDEYLMNLDRSSIFKPALNLTDMPDDKMTRLISSAIAEIDRYYFYKDLVSLRVLAQVISFCRKNGFRKAFRKATGKFAFLRGSLASRQ